MKKLCSKTLKTLINELNRPVHKWETSQKKAICTIHWQRFKSFWWMCYWMCTSVPSRIVHLFFLRDSKMYTPGTIANSQRTSTKINKKWCYYQSKNFSGTSGTTRYVNTIRVIANEMPVLLLNLRWWYFSCLQMYSDNFLGVWP